MMWDTCRPSAGRGRSIRRRGPLADETVLDDLDRAPAERPGQAGHHQLRRRQPDRTLTYRDTRPSVDRFAAALLELGVGPGDVVAIHLPNLWMLTPLYLACTRIGAVARR